MNGKGSQHSQDTKMGSETVAISDDCHNASIGWNISVEDMSINDNRRSEVSRIKVNEGTVTETIQESQIYITGSSQNGSLHTDRESLPRDGGHRKVFSMEDRSVNDNRQSTAANVVVYGGNPTLNMQGAHIHVHDKNHGSSKINSDKIRHITNILARLNKDAWEESEVEITRDFKAEKLNEPPFKVYPQMEESTSFYKGGHPEHEDMPEEIQHMTDLDENSSRTKQITYKKPNTSGAWIPVKPNPVSYDSLKETILEEREIESGKRLGIIGLVAPAGSGKTTCLRRLARDSMLACGISAQNKFIAANEDSRFSLVCFIDLKDINSNDMTTLEKILFEGFFSDDTDMNLAYEWLLDNQSKAALFIDGLDQAMWSVEESDQIKVRPYTEASTSLIMYNLLCRTLLPKTRIVISSREFKAATLPTRARPEKIITLTGFTDEDAEKLFKSLVPPQKGDHPWDKLTSQSSSLARFLFTPLFLIFAAAVSCFTAIPLPRNITGLVAQMLDLLEDSDNIQEASRIWKIIQRLKVLAHEGMERNIVIFTVNDLKKHGLSVSDVRDLLLTVQRSRALSQRVSDAHLNIYFCHQSFQEFLSAMYITEKSVPHFKQFVNDHLHEGRWSVVRQFVFGIIFTLNGAHFQVFDRDQKKQILAESLPHVMATTRKDHEMLELYAALNESDDSRMIRSHLKKITLQATTLGHGGTHLVSCMMARCFKLEEISLMACGLNDQLLRVLIKNLKGKKIEVRVFDVTWSMSELPFSSLNMVLRHLVVNTLRINGSDVSGDGGLDWTVVQRVSVNDILLINEASTVVMKKIRVQNLKGLYNKNDKTLQFTISANQHITNITMDSLLIARKFFDSTCVTLVIEGEKDKQYLKYTNLEKLRNCNIVAKIRKVVLDCDVNHELESTLIISYVAQAHVVALDIKLRNDNYNAIPDQDVLLEELFRRDCHLNIHLRNKVTQSGWKAIGRTHFLGGRIRTGEKASLKGMIPPKTTS